MDGLIHAHYLAGVGMVQWAPLLAALAVACGIGAAVSIWAQPRNTNPPIRHAVTHAHCDDPGCLWGNMGHELPA